MDTTEVVFYFKCYGMAKDENGNLDYGYLKMAAKNQDETNAKVDSLLLDDIKDAYRKLFANMLYKKPEELIYITKEEYIQAVGEESERN